MAAELLFGRSRFILLYLMCGIGGSLASICWHGNGLSVGASGQSSHRRSADSGDAPA